MILDNESIDIFGTVEGYGETMDDGSKEEKRNRKHGLLNWFKLRKRESGVTTLTSSDGDKSSGTKSLTAPSTPQAESINCPAEARISNSLTPENIHADSLLDADHDGGLPSNLSLQETPLTSLKTINHVDLLGEQLKILSGEVALHSSVLKRLSDEAMDSPNKEQIQLDIRKVKNEIKLKNQQIASLEKQMADSISSSQSNMDKLELSPSYAELLEQLNEKSFELEVKTADNRIIQDQLQQKICECGELQETVASLNQQLAQAPDTKGSSLANARPQHMHNSENTSSRDVSAELLQQAHMVSEIEELKLKIAQLTESKSQLETRNQKLAEESTYAKGLASAAGVELKALSEEVTKLMKDNERLVTELASLRNSPRRVSNGPKAIRRDGQIRRQEPAAAKREVNASNHERELLLEATLKEREQRETELQKKVEESKQKEAFLENELASMWVLVAKLKKSHGSEAVNLESKLRE